MALELANAALDAARSGGASYADVRVGRYRRQNVATRERQVLSVADNESYGLGVRVLVDGSWGFAATSRMTGRGAQQAALSAVVLSKAARAVRRHRVELAPVTPVRGTWITPVRTDPIEVSIEDKIALLLAANEAALKVKGVQFVNSGVQALREIKTLVTSEGTNVTQTFIRVGPSFSATAVGNGDFQSFAEALAPRGEGWDYVESLNMPGERRALGVDGGGEAGGPERRGRHLRPDPRAVEPVADDPRIDRPPHRARSRDRRGGQLRRHELRRAAGEDDRRS